MTHKNNAKHQVAARAKKAIEGLKEVRGAWAPTEMHPEVREFASKLTKRRQKAKKD